MSSAESPTPGGARPDGPRTDGMAAEDPATARHERAKTRTFALVLLIAVVLLVGGSILAISPSGWAVLGLVAILLGLGLLLSGTIGLIARARARRMLGSNPWREVAVEVLAAPSSSGRGRAVTVPEGSGGRKLLVSNVAVPAADALRRRGRLWYAGDLTKPGMIFVRLPGQDEVYLAVLSAGR